MANPNAPFGLRPVKHQKGGVLRYNEEYTIADGYGTALYEGDPVLVTGNGTNIQIAAAGTGNKITGVFAGCKYRNPQGDTYFSKYWPAAQATYNGEGAVAFVFDDPDIEFEVMCDTLAAGDIRALANLVAGNGNPQTGISGWTLAHPPGAGENQTKILGLSDGPLPGGIANAYGAYAVARVFIAQHELLLMSNL